MSFSSFWKKLKTFFRDFFDFDILSHFQRIVFKIRKFKEGIFEKYFGHLILLTIFATLGILVLLTTIFIPKEKETKTVILNKKQLNKQYDFPGNSRDIKKVLKDVFKKEDLVENYMNKKDPIEIEKAIGSFFKVPNGYEIAYSKRFNVYPSNENEGEGGQTFTLIAMRQVRPLRMKNDKDYGYPTIDSEEIYLKTDAGKNYSIPAKPAILAFVDEENIIHNFTILSPNSTFPDANHFNNYAKKYLKPENIELKDLNLDGTPEILVTTSKINKKDANRDNRLDIFFYFERDKTFRRVDLAFEKSVLSSYEILDGYFNPLILNAEAGVQECSDCPVVYTFNLYQFSKSNNFEKPDEFVKVRTLVSEKKFKSGEEAIKFKMGEIQKVIGE